MTGIKGRSGPPGGNLNAVTHGGYALKGRLNGTRLDRRSTLYKAFIARVREYAGALGGDPSPQQLALIHDTVKTEYYVEEKEAYLDSLKRRIRKGREHPLMEARRKDRVHIRENIKLFGLKRIAKQVLSLPQYVAQKYAAEEKPLTAPETMKAGEIRSSPGTD